MEHGLFVENNQIAVGFSPVNLATAGGTGDWFDASLYDSVAIVFVKAVGAASQDPTVTVLQGTTNAGGTTAALKFTRVDVKQASALTAVGQFTTVTQSAANTYTSATAGECEAIWVVEVRSDSLDDGKKYIQASVADPGTNAQLATILYIGRNPRYASKALPSALT